VMPADLSGSSILYTCSSLSHVVFNTWHFSLWKCEKVMQEVVNTGSFSDASGSGFRFSDSTVKCKF